MKPLLLHLGLIAVLFVLGAVLPDYHQGNFARVMVLATYAMGYNVLFGYTGLLSLGHAMFFAAGMYGLGLAMHLWDWPAILALPAGLVAAALLAFVVALLTLRTIGVGFMIVTLMFAQAVYLTILYFGDWTEGDEGFVLQAPTRTLLGLDLTNPDIRYYAALALMAAALLGIGAMMNRRFGRVLIALRENEERTRMLGYDTFRHKVGAVVISGTIAGAAGAAYALLFGYVGASFAAVPYSIFPLLWVLVAEPGPRLVPSWARSSCSTSSTTQAGSPTPTCWWLARSSSSSPSLPARA